MATRTKVIDLKGLAIFTDTSPGGNDNELLVDMKKEQANDATAVRFGVWAPELAMKISFDFLTGDDPDSAIGQTTPSPRRSERIMVEFCKDDDPSALPDSGILKIYAQIKPVGEETDAGEVLVAAISSRGLELWKPLLAYAGIGRGADSTGTPHRFSSDNGRYVFNVQGDAGGHIVVYDTWDANGNPLPESTWANTGAVGVVPIQPL